MKSRYNKKTRNLEIEDHREDALRYAIGSFKPDNTQDAEFEILNSQINEEQKQDKEDAQTISPD